MNLASLQQCFIDPPAPCDSLENWEAFLRSLSSADQSDVGIKRHIEIETQHIFMTKASMKERPYQRGLAIRWGAALQICWKTASVTHSTAN